MVDWGCGYAGRERGELGSRSDRRPCGAVVWQRNGWARGFRRGYRRLGHLKPAHFLLTIILFVSHSLTQIPELRLTGYPSITTMTSSTTSLSTLISSRIA